MSRRECPMCGGGIMDSGLDDDENPIWTCRNCYKTMKRRTRKTKKKQERTKMKPTLDKIFNDLLTKAKV